MDPFQCCWDRISRAEAHSKSLSQSWNNVFEGDLYTVDVNVNHDGTGTIEITPKLSDFARGFSLQLGELLYQLRAALDSCVYAAAVIDSGKEVPPNAGGLEFPICTKHDRFIELAANIAPLSKQRRALIEAVQPYNTPDIPAALMIGNYNRSLFILNNWARKDRHRRLHIVGTLGFDFSPKLRLPIGTRLGYMRTVNTTFLKDKCKIADFRIEGWEPSMNVQATPNFSIDISIDEPPAPCDANDRFVARLEGMITTVGVIVRGIEAGVWPIPIRTNTGV
ncbi:MAG: hypothetical protein ABSA39_17460 [Edaphobacter sp.]